MCLPQVNLNFSLFLLADILVAIYHTQEREVNLRINECQFKDNNPYDIGLCKGNVDVAKAGLIIENCHIKEGKIILYGSPISIGNPPKLHGSSPECITVRDCTSDYKVEIELENKNVKLILENSPKYKCKKTQDTKIGNPCKKQII